MAWVETRITRTSQPQDACGIDWTNPITRNLRAVFAPTGTGAYREFISGKVSTNNNGSAGVGVKGVVGNLSSSAISGQFTATTFGPHSNEESVMVIAVNNGAGSKGALLKFGDGNGLAIGLGTTDMNSGGGAQNALLLQENARWILPSPAVVIPNNRGIFSLCASFNSDRSGSMYSPGIGTGTFGTGTNFDPVGQNTYIGGYTANRYPQSEQFLIGFSWSRTVTEKEYDSLYLNPWQIFEPEVSRIWVDDYVSAGGGATVIPIGVQATGSVGTPSATGAANAVPAGVGATASVGTPTAAGGSSIAATALPAGVAASSAVGAPAATGAAVAQPVGVSAVSAVGVPVAIGETVGVTVLPTGVQAFGAVGAAVATGAAVAQPLGVQALTYVGTPTIATGVSGIAVAYPAGVQAIGQIGTLIATGAAWTAAVGVQAVASVGTPTAYAGELVIYTPGAQTRPSRLQSSSRPSRLQTGTRASR